VCFVEVSANNDDVGAGEIGGDMRLRRDDVKLYLAAGQRVGLIPAPPRKRIGSRFKPYLLNKPRSTPSQEALGNRKYRCTRRALAPIHEPA